MTLADAFDVDRLRAWAGRSLGLTLEGARSVDLFAILEERSQASGAAGVSEYLRRLESGTAAREEVRALAERLTIGETYFFRHSDQFKVFERLALPGRIRSRGGSGELRILSAGCASGEELYSLAYLARKVLAAHAGWTCDCLGVDINRASIQKAKQAVYSPWSLRETPEELRQRLFQAHGHKEYALDARLRQAACFEERNLVEEDLDFWRAGRFDVIFCRNVLMYFSRETMREVVARLARALAPDGYLFLGPAETLRGISQDFHLRHTNDSFYYQKASVQESQRQRSQETHGDALGPAATAGDFSSSSDLSDASEFSESSESSDSWVTRISEASARIGALAELACAPRPAAAMPRPPDLSRPRELFQQERYDDAMRALQALPQEEAASAEAQMLRAILLMNRGAAEEATEVCARLLRSDEMNAGAHYLMALAHEHAGRHALAEEQDRMAAYLDASFAMPRLHLGLLARKTGDWETGRRELFRALELLEAEDPSRVLLFGGGFSRAALVQLCRNELKFCEKGDD